MEGPTRVVFCGEDAQQKLQDYLFEWEKRSLTRFVKVKSKNMGKPGKMALA